MTRSGPGEVPSPLRMTLPCRWADGGLTRFAGRARFTRRFGYPGRIDDYERVWLTAAGVEAIADLRLNDTAIGSFSARDGAFEADVTTLLRPRNHLAIEVEGGPEGGLWGEVALEVRCVAFLRGVRVERAPGALQITGSVVGPEERQLELYAVLGRHAADYATVTPLPAGTPFRLAADLSGAASGAEPLVLKVELVNGASVWYTFEHVCAPAAAETPRT